VISIDVPTVVKVHAAIDPKEVEAEAESYWLSQAKKIVEPTRQEIVKSARVTDSYLGSTESSSGLRAEFRRWRKILERREKIPSFGWLGTWMATEGTPDAQRPP